jgi:protein gp37
MPTTDKINEFSQKAWNPITGCTKISSGCVHCYAEKESIRQRDKLHCNKYRNGFDLTLHDDVLEHPKLGREPLRIFVNSMGDLLHEGVPAEFIIRAFEKMSTMPQHLFIVLTKRANVLERLDSRLPWADNIMMGVTVEDVRAKERINSLRRCGARQKMVSAEPLLEDLGELDLEGIDWMMVGGESGEGCRPMEESWVLNVRDQCLAQDVHFTFKQWGGVHRRSNGSLLQGVHYDYRPLAMGLR